MLKVLIAPVTPFKQNCSLVWDDETMEGTAVDPGEDVTPLTPGILQVDPLESRRLAEAEAEVKRLRELARTNGAVDPEAARDDSRVRDIARQRDLAEAQLKAAEATVQSLRARLSTSTNPMESEMKALNQRIAGLEQERNAMAMALNQSHSSHEEALGRIAA